MNSGFAGRRNAIESALLAYHDAPGKYPLLLRRPEILFSSIKEVLQLASGRMPDGVAPPALAVQRAAAFFVRTALLYPAADHYALLGLQRTADAASIRERYRQMMRLTHPDFASSAAAGGQWPGDAAARINQAYEVLSSETLRRRYDEKSGSAAGPAPAPVHEARSRSIVKLGTATVRPPPDPRRLLKRMAAAFGIMGALGLAAGLLARGPDRESLVQRDPPAPPEIGHPIVAQHDTIEKQSFAPRERHSPGLPALSIASAAPPALKPPAPQAPSRIEPAVAPPPLPRTEPAMAPAPFPTRMVAVSAEKPLAADVSAALAPALQAPEPVALNSPAAPAPMLQRPVLLPPIARAPVIAPKPVVIAPAVTMAEAHSMMSALLQQMETGSGERLLNGLDRSARAAPAAQALVREYDALVQGSSSVRVANLRLNGDAREDRLLVRGKVVLEIGGFDNSVRAGELPLEAEFIKRNGAVLMTRLAPSHAAGGGQ